MGTEKVAGKKKEKEHMCQVSFFLHLLLVWVLLSPGSPVEQEVEQVLHSVQLLQKKAVYSWLVGVRKIIGISFSNMECENFSSL